MTNAVKEAYHVLTQILILTAVSHFDPSNGCQFQKAYDNLGYIWSLCRHFLENAHDKEASNDYEARK